MAQKLRLQIGDVLAGTARPVDTDRLQMVTPDGKIMFELTVLDDRSIEIRASDTCKVDDHFRKAALVIRPIVGNVVRIETDIFPES